MRKTIIISILTITLLIVSSCYNYGDDGYIILEEVQFYLQYEDNEYIVLEEVQFYLQDNDASFNIQLIKFPYYSEPLYYLKIYNANNGEYQLIGFGHRVISNLRVLDLLNNNRPYIVVTSGYSGNSTTQSFALNRTLERFMLVGITHEISFIQNNKILYAKVVINPNDSIIEIHTEDGALFQSIHIDPSEVGLRFPFWILPYDLNGDGYVDILAHMGGTQNFVHELFVWNTDLQEFSQAILVGFEALSRFLIRDGYILNTLHSFHYAIEQILVWEGNKLIKIYEEKRYFEEENESLNGAEELPY